MLAVLAAAAALAAPKPNILVFLVDDMGWQETSVPFHTQVTELNRRYRTPNMEALSSQGAKFTQAYAYAVCSPTRISLLTGMNAARHRVTNWTLRKDKSPDDASPVTQPPAWNMNGVRMEGSEPRSVTATPLPFLLRQAGYRTIHVGKAHFGAEGTPGEEPKNLGFDVNIAGHAAGAPGSYWGEKNYSDAWRSKSDDRIWDVPGLEKYHGTDTYLTEALTLEAIQQLKLTVSERKPFYLYMAHYAIHAPWEADSRFVQKYKDQGLSNQNAALASMVEGMDKSLGDLMRTLVDLGVDKNTIILFMSDNGSPAGCPPNLPLRGHKLFPYEGGPRVPMIVRWPGVSRPASAISDPIQVEDLFPTILEWAGVRWKGKVKQPVDGLSFAPIIQGRAHTSQKRAFLWHFPHTYSGQTPFSAVRQGPWKLIYHHNDRRLELFRLDLDLGEKNDLAKSEPKKLKEMAGLLSWLLRERGAQMPTDKATGRPVEYPSEVLP